MGCQDVALLDGRSIRNYLPTAVRKDWFPMREEMRLHGFLVVFLVVLNEG
jgi:hypothetical protein